MKTPTSSFLLFFCLFLPFISEPLQAQETKAVLKDGDIEHFIKTFKPMTEELDALGHNFDDEEDDDDESDPMAAFANMRASMRVILAEKEALTILKKYDWDENFIDTYIAISMGYYYNKMTSKIEKMDEEQKEMSMPIMNLFMDQFRQLVHKKDLDLLQGYMTALDPVFEE